MCSLRALVVVVALGSFACSPDLAIASRDAAADSREDALADAAVADAQVADVAPGPDASTIVDAAPATDALEGSDVPVVRDFAMAGPDRVGIWTGAITGVQGSARVFYPAPSGAERYPLVVFAHGFQLAVNNYDRLLVHVASWGYVVASVTWETRDKPSNLMLSFSVSLPSLRLASLRRS